jgi:hypothetical protein
MNAQRLVRAQAARASVAELSCPAAVHPRLEVRDLQETQPQQWSLFIQAMANLMKKSPDDPTSWHQIGTYFSIRHVSLCSVSISSAGGIHGMPYKTWRFGRYHTMF